MRLLVFGSTGQVACELRRLAPEARFLGRAEADLEDPAACAAAITAFRPEMVINAAAFTAVDLAEDDPARTHRMNAEAPAAMARAAAALGAGFVHISSDYVFDGTGVAPHRPGDPVAPLNVYGASKAAGEGGVRAAGGTHVILRTSWVFSTRAPNFVTTMLRLSQDRPDLLVVEDQIGGPTPARALAEALLQIARALRADPGTAGTYHFAGAPDVSWADFAREILRQAGRVAQVHGIGSDDYPVAARRPLNSRLDCTRTEAVFGIKRPDWRAALGAVLRELEEAT
ncbi:MAG: dTDP-4-dehydrorhamnose reductase [Paracoccaceae bacterium]